MPTVGLAELRAKLSEYVARAKRGEEVLITERGKLIARILPIEQAQTDLGAGESLEEREENR